MKTKLFYLALFSTMLFYSQTQIGADIDGEAEGDHSGWSVSLSSDGSIVAIGAPDNNANGSRSGQVRVYQNTSGAWSQIGADINGEAADDASGYSVSLSNDGSIVAIGAIDNDESGFNSGHVRVYKYISGVWSQLGADIDGEGAADNSGTSVSLSADGDTIAIGAPRNAGNAENGWYSGHVRIYKNISGVWTQVGDDIDGEAAHDDSGWCVSLSADGRIVAIGAPDNDANGSRSGQVRVYRNNLGDWTQIGTDIDGEAANDESGTSLSLSADATTVAIGALGNDANGYDSGHVRVYENTSGVWTQIGADIDGEAIDDLSGYSVSLSADGNIVAIGAQGNDDNGIASGHVRVYKNIAGVWSQLGTDIDGESMGSQSGYSVSLSADGNTVAIGAYQNSDNGGSSGQVRVYDLSALLSLEANEISKKFTLYPNPVHNELQLQLSPTLDYINATIYNYSGQLVLQSNTTTINVSSLSAGIYFIEIETNKGKGVKKFIKR